MITINKDKITAYIKAYFGEYGCFIHFSKHIGTTSDNLSRMLSRGTMKEEFLQKIADGINKGRTVEGHTVKPLKKVKIKDLI